MGERTCSVDDCERSLKYRGWCRKHYERWRAHGDPLITLRNMEPDPLCSIQDCERPHRARGWCSVHYDRWRTTGDPEGKVSTRTTETCQATGCDNTYLSWSRKIYCSQECRYRQANERARVSQYGVTPERYAELLEEQDHVCAVCGRPETAMDNKGEKVKTLAVDHCHETGRVRGLLCHACNSGIGSLGDDPSRLAAAFAYLVAHQEARQTSGEASGD